MRFYYAATVFFFAPFQTSAAECNADNCLRAIRASTFPTRSGAADCFSYLRATSTQTTTSTFTTTTTVSQVSGNQKRSAQQDLEARAISSGKNTPKYASVCRGTSAYISACSCIGITTTTVTAPNTVTVSTIVTVSTTAPTPRAFYLQYSSPDSATTFVASVAQGNLKLVDKATVISPQTFQLSSSGMVVPSAQQGSAFYYYAPSDRNSYPIFVVSSVENSYPPLICSIGSSNDFNCQWYRGPGSTIFCHGGMYDSQLAIAKDATSFGDTCSGGNAIVLTAVYVTP